MKQLNKTVILGAIAILIVILIIIMTFIYVNDIREKQLSELKEKQKEEISLIDQLENLTNTLELYRGEDLIYGQGIIKYLNTSSNEYYLLIFDNIEYHPKNLPNNYKTDNLTINFIAYKNESFDPISEKQYINFLRINYTDIELAKQ